MGYIRKKLVALSLILFSTIMLFYGCDNNKYKNLKLNVSNTDMEIVLDEEPQNNLFSITARVSDMPKGYDGAVEFIVPVNDFITPVTTKPQVNDGVSVGVFEAKKQGGPITITVRTLEGNLQQNITVRVVKPITSINFTTAVVPVVKGERTDISKFLNFNPEGTTQNGVRLELSSPVPSDVELIRVVTDGQYLTVPQDLNVTEFKMRARSTVNEEIVSEFVTCKVVELVPVDKIVLMNNHNTPNTTEDDLALEKNSSGEYNITLATNTENLFSKTVYFNFDNDPNLNNNYIVSVTGRGQDGSITNEDGTPNSVIQVDETINTRNSFDLKAIGNGKTKIEFVIKHAEFPDYEPFTQKIVLNINVEAFPKTIEVTDGTNNVALNQIKLFANYDGTNLFGTPFKIVVKNETGEMTNQKVTLSLNSGQENIFMYDRYKNPVAFNEPINAGQTYYLTHNFTAAPVQEITLSIVSETYNEVFLNIPIVIETQEIVLSTDTPEVHIDINNPTLQTPLQIKGLPATYNLTQLRVELVKNDVSDASSLVEVVQSATQIALLPKGKIGECYVNVIAPNGSQVTFKIILFESLNSSNSSITFAGTQIPAKDELGGVVPEITIKNGLNVQINFVINGNSYTNLNGTGLIYNANSQNTGVAQIKPNYQIQTQNMGGTSRITIQITGFNEAGEQSKIIYFEFDVKVSVPIDKLETTTREVTIYDTNTLSSNLVNTYGTHEIVLTSTPSNASFTYKDLYWVFEFNDGETIGKYEKEEDDDQDCVYPIENGDDLIYTFITNGFDIITLKTTKSNFKRATVTCQINSGSNNLTFNIIARVNQQYKNETGATIDSPKSESVRFIVYKAQKVENIVFQNVKTNVINGMNYFELVFDERDLGWNGSTYTNTQNSTREISFDVYPSDALYKDLAAVSNNSAVEVKVNNITKVITVTVKTRISGTEDVIVTVYPLDSVNGADIGFYYEIKVRVLDGTLENPFEIENQDDLLRINSQLEANYVLTSNITITMSNWTPIGFIDGKVTQFNGTLSGKNVITDKGQIIQTSYYTISGMRINGADSYRYLGLFAYLGTDSVVSDLTINNFRITANVVSEGNLFAGALAGYAEGIIENVSINDLSGVQAFNGNHYENVEHGVVPDSGIYITSNTETDKQAYYFVGGLVGFINNANLHHNSATQPVSDFAAKGDKTENNSFEEITLKTNYASNIETTEPYKQIVNASVVAQINVQTNSHNIAYVGGVVGFNNRAIITKTNTQELSFGSDSADVFVAINANIANGTQKIANQNSAYGGVAGFNNGIIENVQVKASILGVYDKNDTYMSNIGGVVGYNVGTIENTKSFPLIRGYKNVGGIVGKSESAIVYISNIVNNTKHTFVNGLSGIGGGGFTMEDGINFNTNFQITIEKFETVSYDYNQFVSLINENYFDNSQQLTQAQDLVTLLYSSASGLLPDNFYATKITRQNLLSGLSNVEYNVRAQNYNDTWAINSHYYNSYTQEALAKGLSFYGSNIIRNNSVEFLSLEDSIIAYNTAIIGFDNVGGVVGEYVGLFANGEETVHYISSYPAAITYDVINYNPIQFNTVYNYSKLDVESTDNFTGRGFYGNILLSYAHGSEVDNKNRNFAGGLVGKLTNGVVTNNQVFASIQSDLAGIGGLVGKADGITQISNSSFVGVLYNKDQKQNEFATAATGGLVGDAKNSTTTFAYIGEYNESSQTEIYKFAGSKILVNYYEMVTTNSGSTSMTSRTLVESAINSSYNNIKHSYYSATDPLGTPIVSQETETDNNKSLGFVGDGQKEINIAFKYVSGGGLVSKEYGDTNEPYLKVLTDTLKVNQNKLMSTASNGTETDLSEISIYIEISNGQAVKTANYNTFIRQTRAYGIETEFDNNSVKIDANGDGLKDSDTGLDYSTSYSEFINNHLANTVWYYNYQVNYGIPVLLSNNKLEVADDNSYKISLLANFPPTQISILNKQNYVDSFIAQINDAIENEAISVINFYELDESNYILGGTQINFGNNNQGLTDSLISRLTNDLLSELTSLNTYSIDELLNIEAIPTFIGANSFKITSSNGGVVSVEFDENNQIKFVAKSVGETNITITSAYNPDISATLKLYVVNASQNLDLTYYVSGQKTDLSYGKTLFVNKSTQNNQVALPVSSVLNSTYTFTSGSNVNKTFTLSQNTNSGIRYYYLANKTYNLETIHTIYHLNPIDISSINVLINNQTFVEERVGTQYIYYVDVPYGNTADIIGTEESLNSLLAVPYIHLQNTDEKVLLLKQGDENSVIDFGEDYKYNVTTVVNQAQQTTPTSILGGFEIPSELTDMSADQYVKLIINMISKFDVKVSKASWKISQSTNSIQFPVNGTPNFSIEIETDKDAEELYIVYSDSLGNEKVISVTDVKDRYNSKIKIDQLTLLVNNTITPPDSGTNSIIYNFGLVVEDEDKLNVTQEINRTFKFFVVKQNAPELIKDANGFVTNSISSIAEENMIITLPVKLVPQDITSITLKHYPNAETTSRVDENGNTITEVNLNEIAYDNLIPGHVGILKAYVSPYFAYFDELEIVSSGSGNSIVLFEQMYANITKTDEGVLYDGTYETLISSNNSIPNGIKLQKTSFKDQDGNIGYDGNIYIRTLVNSLVTEADSFTLTINAKINGVIVKTGTITLDVQTPPSINLSINGDKEAPIARGTEQQFSVTLNGVEGNIDFSSSYTYLINSNGMEVTLGKIGTDFNVNVRNGVYTIDTNVNLPTNRYIKIIGTVTKQINGETITHTDSLTLKVTDFVIDEITVDRVTNGNITGYFNQPYSLIVRINKATYNESIANEVKEKIAELEKEFSKSNGDNIEVWRSVNQTVSVSDPKRYGTLSLGYNSAKTFIVGEKLEVEFNNTKVYSIQNTRFDSGDRLAAVVEYIYTDNGIIPLVGENKEIYESVTSYRYEKTSEFGFGFYRIRDEERPDPIENVEDFMDMEDGVDYILVNDITLTDWVPFRDDLKINSLDGNGYVITIESFALDEYVNEESLIPNKNIGIFGKINSGTTIKNLIIEVAPTIKSNSIELANYDSTQVDLLVDATAYKNVNFGLLAGENAGIVTNVQVVKDAGELRLERELTFAAAYPSDPLYRDYMENGTFNKNQFIIDNFERFYPGKDYLKDPITNEPNLDANGELQIIAKENTSTRRDLSVVRVQTTTTVDVQTHYMAGLVGRNLDEGTDALGYITNSSVENITINGVGYVAGFVASNSGKISSSYFKGANIINRVAENYAEAATGGFVVYNTGTNAAIQYSYVQGRLGEGSKYADPDNGNSMTNADKTGLSEDAKKDFAGYNYINSDEKADGYRISIARLRALNAIVTSRTRASAFVYENDAAISNSYANIMVNSSMQTSGFVFNNTENGTISSSYTLSSVRTNSMASSPFTGRSSDYTYNNANPDGFNDVHYLKIGSDDNALAPEIANAEEFLDENEPATALGASQFGEYNTFQGYAFNTDFEQSSEDNILRSVWFIPNGESEILYDEHFKNDYYVQSRPELVAANLKTTSIRVWTGSDESGENSYNYISTPIGDSVHNPLLVKSAENFNSYLNYDSTVDVKDRNFAIRFISDIAFNKTDLTAQTYNMDYYGDLDGNGMTIKELRIVSDTDFENPETGETIEYLGLFGRIITQPLDEENSQRGVVRNLNIEVSEVRGSKVTYVGALAGSIENANVFNVNISGDEVIQGKNMVGGLAGIITGDSEIVNITSTVSARAAYFKESNRFSTSYPNELVSVYGTFDIYNNETIGEEIVTNAETVSYVGGIAGIFDVDEREEDEQLSPLSLFNSRARKLTVTGSVSLTGEIVGGIFGLNGEESTASDLTFIIDPNSAPELRGSRISGGIIGENRGEVERSYVEHNSELQEKIDESYKTAVANGTNPKVTNSDLNYNTLFKNNANYIGGFVGFNNGGTIKNSYSKVNVINLNSMFAGGFVGLSIGGQYNFCYTIATVSAFKVAGGFAGIQTVNSFKSDSGNITIDNPIGNYILISRNAESVKNIATGSNGITKYVGVVAANIWRDEDLVTDRRTQYNSNYNLALGGMIGIALDEANSKGNLVLSNIATSSGTLNERYKNETNFFVQPKFTNSAAGTYDDNLPEIGSFNGNDLSTNDSMFIENDLRFSTGSRERDPDDKTDEAQMGFGDYASDYSTTMEKPNGISGFVAEYKQNEKGEYVKPDGTTTTITSEAALVYYQYSRMQNLSSARTLKEIITTLDVIATEAANTGDKFANDKGTIDEVLAGELTTSPIFGTWNVNRWTGVRKETDADLNTTFPYLEAKPETTRIEVWNREDLLQMGVYTNAEFVLMTDIDLKGETNNETWDPIGTRAIPFKGTLHSNTGNQYTIYNVNIQSASTAFVGLVGYSSEAEFRDFNLANVNININNSNQGALFIGSLVGYASMGTIVDNVNIVEGQFNAEAAVDVGAQIKTSHAGTVGGLVGYSNSGIIKNCGTYILSKNGDEIVYSDALNNPGDNDTVSIEINGIGNFSQLENDINKTLAFGGLVGYITSVGPDEPMIQNSFAYGKISFNANGNTTNKMTFADNSTLNNEVNRSVDIGGLVGRSNDASSEVARIVDVKTGVKLNVLIDFANSTSVNEINVGGIAGKSTRSFITEDRVATETSTQYLQNSVNANGTNNINISNYNRKLNYGGAVGYVVGSTLNEESASTAYSNYEISQIIVGKLDDTKLKTSVTLSSNATDSNTILNVGGAVGEASVANISNVNANIEFDATINPSVSNSNPALFNVAGLVAKIENGQLVENSMATGSLKVSNDNNASQTNVTTKVGGAFADVIMANGLNGIGKINKIISNVDVNVVYPKNPKEIGSLTVGGFVGQIYNGIITESANLGNVGVNGSKQKSDTYVGGFVGRIDLKNKMVSNINNDVQIKNSYSVGDLELTSMFEGANSKNKAGLFVGDILYGYNSGNSKLVLRNNYTAGKYIYNSTLSGETSSKYFDALYSEKVNKGGFLGGFTIESKEIGLGITTRTIENASNLLFANNFYNTDFVPYGNSYMEGLTVQEMLFSPSTKLNSTLTESFNGDQAWIIQNNSYPRLSWIDNSKNSIASNGDITENNLANSIAGSAVNGLQIAGTKVQPRTLSTSSLYNLNSSNTSYIINSSGNVTIDATNVNVYFNNNLSANTLTATTLDSHSLIYGFKTTTSNTKANITNNYGLIVNSSIKNALVENNYGAIYQVTFNAFDGMNGTIKNVVLSNAGAIDTVVANSAFNGLSTSNKAYIAGTNNGSIYRSVIKNNTGFDFAGTNTNGKFASSYITTKTTAGSNTTVVATYYDELGKVLTQTIYNSADSTQKFDLTKFDTNILNIEVFDFVNDWTILNSTTEALNYGAPMLQYELKPKNTSRGGFDFNGQIEDKYYWNSTVTEVAFNTFVTNNKDKFEIEVDSASDLAEIANMINNGHELSTLTSIPEMNTDSIVLENTSVFEANTDGMSKKLTTTTYKFGVKQEIVKNIIDFEGKTIKLTKNIDLSGKLWTPIGSGFDNLEVSATDTATISSQLRNMFKGQIEGSGFSITNVSAIGTNKNVGLFGTVYVSSGTPFANNILIKNSNFISVSENGGFALAGALAGRVVIDNNANVLTKVGTEYANVYATNRASGIVGDIYNVSGIEQSGGANRFKTPSMKYAYVNSNVTVSNGTRNVASAIVHFGNNAPVNNSNVSAVTVDVNSISEMYFAGEIGDYRVKTDDNSFARVSQKTSNYAVFVDKTKVSDKHAFMDNIILNNDSDIKNSFYAIGFADTNVMSESNNITADYLTNEAIPNFTWGAAWTRMTDQNNNYPVLNTKVSYWVQDTQAVTPSGNTYTINNAKQLAWIADQVNSNNTEVKGFAGKTIKLNANIDLSGKIWSAIGYDSNVYFNGTFDFNGHSITNMITSGTYVKDTSVTGVKCVGANYVGLFGYTVNATITSTGKNPDGTPKLGTVGNGSDNSKVISLGAAGGVVGFAQNTQISNVENYVSITSTSSTDNQEEKQGSAGIVGTIFAVQDTIKLDNLVNHGEVSVNQDYAGGIVGMIYGNTTTSVNITKSRNVGNISGKNRVGGIVGGINDSSSTFPSLSINGVDNYTDDTAENISTTPDNTGTISGTDYVGGIVGENIGGTIEGVTNTGTISGSTSVGGIVGKITKNARVYEAVNTGTITGTSNSIGGIAGYVFFADSTDSTTLMNLLNKSEQITSQNSSAQIGKIVGSFYNGSTKAHAQVFMAVDTSADTKLFGSDNNNKNESVVSLSSIADLIRTNTNITYDGSKYETYLSVFNDSLVWRYISGSAVTDANWSGVSSSTNKNNIKLAYNNKPGGEEPSRDINGNYNIYSQNNLIYLSDLNTKRFGVSSASGKAVIASNITLTNVEPLGFGAYPWKIDVDGQAPRQNHTLTVNSVSSSATNSALFGSVFGSSSDNVEFTNFKFVFSPSSVNAGTGLIVDAGNYVSFNNIQTSKSGTLSVNGNFGVFARELTNSKIQSCTNGISISSSNSENVGGLVGKISYTSVVSSINYGNITATSVTYLGGLVGHANGSSSDDNKTGADLLEYINNNTNEGNITANNGSPIVGGIVGYSRNYNYNNNTYGSISRDNGVFEKRNGLIQTNYRAGGIIGQSNEDKILNRNVNNGEIKDSNSSNSSLRAGGIVGYASDTIIGQIGQNSGDINENYGLIIAKRAGGIVGHATNVTIINASNDEVGEIITLDGYAGGVVGYSHNVKFDGCSSDGFVAANTFATSSKTSAAQGVGGIAGYATRTNSSIYYFTNCTVDGYVGLKEKTRNGINSYYTSYNVDNLSYNGTQYTGASPKGDKGKWLNTVNQYPYGTVVGSAGSNYTNIDETTTTSPTLRVLTVYDYYVNVNNGETSFAGFGEFWVEVKAFMASATISNKVGGFSFANYSSLSTTRGTRGIWWFSGAQPSDAKTSNNFSVVPVQRIEANGNTPTYTVKYVTNVSGISLPDETYYANDQFNPPTISRDDARFDGWFDSSGTKYNAGDPITKNVTLTARWTENTYSINLYGKNGQYPEENNDESFENSLMGTQSVVHGQGIDMDFPEVTDKSSFTRQGFALYGWFMATVDYWNETVDEANSGGPATPGTSKKGARDAIISMLERNGENIDNWGQIEDEIKKVQNDVIEGTGYDRIQVKSTTSFTENGSIYARWVAVKKVTFVYNDGTTPNLVKEVGINMSVERPDDPDRAGYYIEDWYTNPNFSGTPYNFSNPVTTDITLYAKWVGVEINVVLDYGDPNGELGLGSATVEYGQKMAVPKEPTTTGYRFKFWSLDGQSTQFDFNLPITNENLGFDIASSKTFTLVAHWDEITYTINFYTLPGETLYKSITVKYGGSVESSAVTEPTRTGYTFSTWKISEDSGQTLLDEFPFGKEIFNNYNVYAEWIPIPQTVKFVYDIGEGEVEIESLQQKVDYDSHATQPETNPSLEGYRFDGWYTSKDYLTPFNFEETVIQGETKIYAKFVEQVTVTFIIKNDSGVDRQEEIEIDINTVVPTELIPDLSDVVNEGTIYHWAIYDAGTGTATDETVDLSTHKFQNDTAIIIVFD